MNQFEKTFEVCTKANHSYSGEIECSSSCSIQNEAIINDYSEGCTKPNISVTNGEKSMSLILKSLHDDYIVVCSETKMITKYTDSFKRKITYNDKFFIDEDNKCIIALTGKSAIGKESFLQFIKKDFKCISKPPASLSEYITALFAVGQKLHEKFGVSNFKNSSTIISLLVFVDNEPYNVNCYINDNITISYSNKRALYANGVSWATRFIEESDCLYDESLDYPSVINRLHTFLTKCIKFESLGKDEPSIGGEIKCAVLHKDGRIETL